MPLLLHCLYIIQVNSYVLYKETFYLHRAVNNDNIKTHKEFLIEFINSLILCAKKKDTNHSVTTQGTPVGEVELVINVDQTQQIRFSRTHLSLEIYDHVRFQSGDHRLVPYTHNENVNTVNI